MANTNIPIFAVGNHADILPAIRSKLLTYPSYIYCKDTNTIAFLDSELNVRDVVGWNQSQIIVVNDLPSAKAARTDAFYICNGSKRSLFKSCFRCNFRSKLQTII